ncbi:uncharacterized protein LOC134856174, partial [Symsagittifera roscoffensis]|uniref:uncharacterized protein LOC134856174 n=1 Tax=Symsagittifera roscoffensis TaxID=84072 RepID=UPI00307CBE55
WLYRAGLEKRNKNSLIMDLRDMKVQHIQQEDVKTEILKRVGQRRASEMATADSRQWRNIKDHVHNMSRQMIEVKALCDSADADGIIEKYFEVEEQNQARMSLLLEQEAQMDKLKKEINELQTGVRRMTVTGKVCDRDSCDTSEHTGAESSTLGEMQPPRNRQMQTRAQSGLAMGGGGHGGGSGSMGRRRSTQITLEKRRATLNSQKQDLRRVYDKIQQCLETAGGVSDCLANRLGPDKQITEKTVSDCLARLNERVDELLMVKAYFDYRKANEHRAHYQLKDHEDSGPPITNPFIGNLEKKQAKRMSQNSAAEMYPSNQKRNSVVVNDKELPYAQLYGEKKSHSFTG